MYETFFKIQTIAQVFFCIFFAEVAINRYIVVFKIFKNQINLAAQSLRSHKAGEAILIHDLFSLLVLSLSVYLCDSSVLLCETKKKNLHRVPRRVHRDPQRF
jgi:hypothetical protein